MQTRLEEYFERIAFDGEAKPGLAALKAIHRAHALSIPYENLDVYLERPVDQDVDRIFNKIVREGRGGWCYEMNGLLGWALGEIGFDAARHVGGVFRAEQGDSAFGNHLVHTVKLEETPDTVWVVDVGIGQFIKQPVMLKDGPVSEEGETYRLENLSDGTWRFHNAQGRMPPSFDFIFGPAEESRLDETCQNLQSDPTSMFRQNLICQQMTATGFKALIGRTWKDTDKGIDGHLVESEAELHERIVVDLGITPPPLGGLWDKVVSRHEEIFGNVGK